MEDKSVNDRNSFSSPMVILVALLPASVAVMEMHRRSLAKKFSRLLVALGPRPGPSHPGGHAGRPHSLLVALNEWRRDRSATIVAASATMFAACAAADRCGALASGRMSGALAATRRVGANPRPRAIPGAFTAARPAVQIAFATTRAVEIAFAMAALQIGSTTMPAGPTLPALPATPAEALAPTITAPVPARALPSIVVPAVPMPRPNELGSLGQIETVEGGSDAVGRADRRSFDASTDQDPAGNQRSCRSRGQNKFTDRFHR